MDKSIKHLKHTGIFKEDATKTTSEKPIQINISTGKYKRYFGKIWDENIKAKAQQAGVSKPAIPIIQNIIGKTLYTKIQRAELQQCVTKSQDLGVQSVLHSTYFDKIYRKLLLQSTNNAKAPSVKAKLPAQIKLIINDSGAPQITDMDGNLLQLSDDDLAGLTTMVTNSPKKFIPGKAVSVANKLYTQRKKDKADKDAAASASAFSALFKADAVTNSQIDSLAQAYGFTPDIQKINTLTNKYVPVFMKKLTAKSKILKAKLHVKGIDAGQFAGFLKSALAAGIYTIACIAVTGKANLAAKAEKAKSAKEAANKQKFNQFVAQAKAFQDSLPVQEIAEICDFPGSDDLKFPKDVQLFDCQCKWTGYPLNITGQIDSSSEINAFAQFMKTSVSKYPISPASYAILFTDMLGQCMKLSGASNSDAQAAGYGCLQILAQAGAGAAAGAGVGAIFGGIGAVPGAVGGAIVGAITGTITAFNMDSIDEHVRNSVKILLTQRNKAQNICKKYPQFTSEKLGIK